MIIHYDGSNAYKWDGIPANKRMLGWGVHAVEGGTITERYGALETHINGPLSSWHETLALFEAVKVALEFGKRPQDVSFYTDDEVAAYGSYQLGGPTFMAWRKDDVLLRAVKAVAAIYGKNMEDQVLAFLRHSRFTKIKGHRFTVINQRVDYLAKKAIKVHMGVNKTPVMGYAEWLRSGIEYWKDNEAHRYVPAFSI